MAKKETDALEDPLNSILVFDGFQRALSFHISPIFILGTLGKVRRSESVHEICDGERNIRIRVLRVPVGYSL